MMLPHTPQASDPVTTMIDSSRNVVRIGSLLTFISGLLLTWQPILRHFHHDTFARFLLPPDAMGLADFTSIILGLLLMMLAYELLLRKRAALYLTLGISIASVLNDFAWQHPTPSTFFALAVIFVLGAGNTYFVATAKGVHLRRGILALVSSVLVALAYGTFGFWALSHRDIGSTFSLIGAFEETLRQYVGLGGAELVTHSHYSRWFLDSLHLVGIVTALYCLYSILRPLNYEYHTLPAERLKAKELLERYSKDTDDYFKLWPEDKSYFFNAAGTAFVAYGVARGVAVALGNPVGEAKALPGVLADFTTFCLQNGWLVVFVQVDGSEQRLFDHLGYQTLPIGADAMIDLDTFVSDTARNKHFRNIRNRFSKTGFSTERSLPPHAPELLNEVQAITNDWLTLPAHREWYFVAGSHSVEYLNRTPLFVVRDADGNALAFANEVPSYKRGYATIDLMRHRKDIPSNIMDYLFLELLERLHSEGYHYFNLGLSPLAAKQAEGSLGERLRTQIYLESQRFFVSTHGLNQFKNKFKPEWEPRYSFYLGSNATLPHMALALTKLSASKPSR